MDRSAKPLIAVEDFDPQIGARLLDPLATKILLGECKLGDRIRVVAPEGELEFAKK